MSFYAFYGSKKILVISQLQKNQHSNFNPS
jgi:hypothetical protein